MLINANKSTFLFKTFKIYLGNPSKTEKCPNNECVRCVLWMASELTERINESP